MNKIYSFIYRCHKWFGIPLAIMFIMWYISGIVMLYHQFPRLTPSTTPVEEVDAVSLQQVWSEVPDTFSNCKIMFSGSRPLVSADGETYGAFTPDRSDLERVAESFSTYIAKIDTLQDIDKWIPFNRLMKHLPIYRITGNDGSYTYVSSKTGEVIEHNTRVGRAWAWVGALPHYVYITPIRRDVDLWKKVVIWMSGLSTISVIFGIIIALRFLIKKRKLNLFKRRSWQWHYSFGLFFGLFMLAFIFSGMMSLAKIPDWIMKSTEMPENNSVIVKGEVDLSMLPRKMSVARISSYPTPRIETYAGERNVVTGLNPSCPLDFSQKGMKNVVERLTGESVKEVVPVSHDIFYKSDKPGFKATTENFTVYWNDEGYFRIMDRKGKAQAICYRFLHNMGFPGLNRICWLHQLFMWIVLLGGLVIVLTGTILSICSFHHPTSASSRSAGRR